MLQVFAALNSSFLHQGITSVILAGLVYWLGEAEAGLGEGCLCEPGKMWVPVFDTASRSWTNHLFVLLLSSLPAREGKYLLPAPLKAALKMNTLPSIRFGIRTPVSGDCLKVDESVRSDLCMISFRARFRG